MANDPQLERFYKARDAGQCDRVLGTYLWPWRLFDAAEEDEEEFTRGEMEAFARYAQAMTSGVPAPEHVPRLHESQRARMDRMNDPYAAVEVLRAIPADGHEILVTRLGGLFIRIPETFDVVANAALRDYPVELAFDPTAPHPNPDRHKKWAYQQRVADLFNLVICELALNGVVGEPVSTVEIEPGYLYENHALISEARGGRELYRHRTIAPTHALSAPEGRWRMTPLVRASVLDQVASLSRAFTLRERSPLLPGLVAGAYSLYSRGQLAEAIVDAWVVCEQVIEHHWSLYPKGLPSATAAQKKRMELLKSTAVYPASVRIEILQSHRLLPDALCEVLHVARNVRNKLAHRAELSPDGAAAVSNALIQVLKHELGQSVAAPLMWQEPNW